MPGEFKLERYFSKYEFKTKYLLCCSDVEALGMEELLELADDECNALWKNLKLGYTESRGTVIIYDRILLSLYLAESFTLLDN